MASREVSVHMGGPLVGCHRDERTMRPAGATAVTDAILYGHLVLAIDGLLTFWGLGSFSSDFTLSFCRLPGAPRCAVRDV